MIYKNGLINFRFLYIFQFSDSATTLIKKSKVPILNLLNYVKKKLPLYYFVIGKLKLSLYHIKDYNNHDVRGKNNV